VALEQVQLEASQAAKDNGGEVFRSFMPQEEAEFSRLTAL